MSKVFITGINSFTGQYLEKFLIEKGLKVFGLVNEKSLNENHYYGDLLDKKSLSIAIKKCSPDIVIHLAAVTFVGLENSHNYYNVNVLGTENLLKALYETEINFKKVLVASSANVYGNSGLGPLKEELCPFPVNHYANSKLAMEYMTRTWFNKLPIIITRPFNYTGIGQDTRFLIPKIVHHFKTKCDSIELGNVNVKRDFSDVRDIVKAMYNLIISEIHSDIFNLCSGKALALKEIVEHLNQLAKYEINIQVNPKFIRKNEIETLVGDCSKLMNETRFKSDYTIHDTLDAMFYGTY